MNDLKNKKLPGDYIAGFVDGEGCFALKFRRDVKYSRKDAPVYFYWDIEFAIVLRMDDIEILERIQTTLNCGKININNKSGTVRFAINTMGDLSKTIVPFFEKYQLHAKKRFDFELWKEALFILNKENHSNGKSQKFQMSQEESQRLKKIIEEMRQYKSGSRTCKWIT